MSINKENVKDIKLIDKIVDGTQQITFNNAISGLTASTIKGAIDEIAANLNGTDTYVVSGSVSLNTLTLTLSDGGTVSIDVSGIQNTSIGTNTITFNTSYVQTGLEPVGTLSWNQTDQTLDLVVPDGSIYQISQEEGVVARNLSGSTLVNGSIVRITGASGSKVTVDIADNTTEPTSSATFGVCTQTIANNSTGRVTTSGLVRNLDTSMYAEGIPLWLDGAGAFTSVKPVAPDHLVHIGWVVRSHATEGMILVKISNGWELDELHDVKITNISNGQLLQWNSTVGVWENKDLTSMPIFTNYVEAARLSAIAEATAAAVALAIALG